MRSLNKIDDNTDDSTYGVCYGFIRKLTGWFTVQVMNYPHQCTMLKIILHKDKKSTRMCGQFTWIWMTINLTMMQCHIYLKNK